MKLRTSKQLLTASMLLMALASAQTVVAQTEAEPNNTIAQANVLPNSNTTVTGTFSTFNDIDYFRITLTETTTLTLNLYAGTTPGVCASGSDPLMSLLNAAGELVAQDDDYLGATLCSRIDPARYPVVGSLPAGVYYVKASIIIGGNNSPYRLVISAAPAPAPISESFTYQGKLDVAGAPVNGETAMRFSLWSHPTSTLPASRLSLPIQYPGIAVINGLFAADLDFTIPNAPSHYNGTERFLQIEVADLNGSGNFTTLEPRQRLSPTPHAIYALTAGRAAQATQADNATNAGYAYNAQVASYAADAGSADTAITVPWSGITGKPAEFADNDDATGGWTEGGGVTYTGLLVGINTSNPGSFDLAVAGTAAKSGGGSWAVFSDERLKHDIKPMAGTLDRLLQLRGYTYEYDAYAIESRLALPGTQIGLMAQEVERVFPDWVAKDAQGYRYVTERSTTALMVEALRDLRAEKDAAASAAQAQIEDLKGRLAALEAAIKASASTK